ncbi:hypothetical protein QQ045_009481 [Rhodiola kirilowii]
MRQISPNPNNCRLCGALFSASTEAAANAITVALSLLKHVTDLNPEPKRTSILLGGHTDGAPEGRGGEVEAEQAVGETASRIGYVKLLVEVVDALDGEVSGVGELKSGQ